MKDSNKIEIAFFDMDGTIFSSNINWKEVKKELNINGTSILEAIYNGKNFNKTDLRYLEKIEEDNTLQAEPLNGAYEFVKQISDKGIRTALITNNSHKNTNYLIGKYNFSFDAIITRDNKMWKPSPAAFKTLLDKFGILPENSFSIGDSDLDITASINAGISDIYIINNADIRNKYPIEIRFFRDYSELSNIIFNV